MTDDGLRALAASLARIELRLARIEESLETSRRREVCHAGLVDALQDYFGCASFTAGTVLLACEDSRSLADAVAAAVDFNLPPHGRAVQLGRLLASLPGLVRVGGHRRGAVLWRIAPTER